MLRTRASGFSIELFIEISRKFCLKSVAQCGQSFFRLVLKEIKVFIPLQNVDFTSLSKRPRKL